MSKTYIPIQPEVKYTEKEEDHYEFLQADNVTPDVDYDKNEVIRILRNIEYKLDKILEMVK